LAQSEHRQDNHLKGHSIPKLPTFTEDKNVPGGDAESYLRAEASATQRFI
jgi:hypothetical protein